MFPGHVRRSQRLRKRQCAKSQSVLREDSVTAGAPMFNRRETSQDSDEVWFCFSVLSHIRHTPSAGLGCKGVFALQYIRGYTGTCMFQDIRLKACSYVLTVVTAEIVTHQSSALLHHVIRKYFTVA